MITEQRQYRRTLTTFPVRAGLLYGVLAVGLAFLVSKFGGVLQASLAINGALSGPILGVFSLGIFVPFANGKV